MTFSDQDVIYLAHTCLLLDEDPQYAYLATLYQL